MSGETLTTHLESTANGGGSATGPMSGETLTTHAALCDPSEGVAAAQAIRLRLLNFLDPPHWKKVWAKNGHVPAYMYTNPHVLGGALFMLKQLDERIDTLLASVENIPEEAQAAVVDYQVLYKKRIFNRAKQQKRAKK